MKGQKRTKTIYSKFSKAILQVSPLPLCCNCNLIYVHIQIQKCARCFVPRYDITDAKMAFASSMCSNQNSCFKYAEWKIRFEIRREIDFYKTA